MMKFDEASNMQKLKLEENESSDFKEVRDLATGPISSSSSSSTNEQTKFNSSDKDQRGSLDRLDTTTSDARRNEDGNKTTVPALSGTYDRESDLRELANPKNIKRFRTILKIARTRKYSDYDSRVGNNNGEVLTDANQESLVEELREVLQSIPDSMLHLLTGTDRPGDCGRPSNQKPDWLDEEKLRMGQKFAQDYMFSVYFTEMLSFLALFSFEDNLKPLIITGKSSTPYTAFKRYLSTGLRVRNWYTQDSWAEGTSARKDILAVKAMHAAARRRLEALTNEQIDATAKIPNAWCPSHEILRTDYSESCEAPAIGQCPYMTTGFSSDRSMGINQSEMALTQWGFVGLIICYPQHFGIHYATDKEFEGFCHLWRSIGYQLGIEDEFNFCRGTLDEIRRRSEDFVETWVKPNLRVITPEWEHMLRCIYSGMEVLQPGADFETYILYLSEILDLKMPRLYASLSYTAWIQHNLRKYIFHYAMKLPGISGFLNNLMNRTLDRGKNLTPEMMEAIQLKLRQYPGSSPLDKREMVQ